MKLKEFYKFNMDVKMFCFVQPLFILYFLVFY